MKFFEKKEQGNFYCIISEERDGTLLIKLSEDDPIVGYQKNLDKVTQASSRIIYSKSGITLEQKKLYEEKLMNLNYRFLSEVNNKLEEILTELKNQKTNEEHR